MRMNFSFFLIFLFLIPSGSAQSVTIGDFSSVVGSEITIPINFTNSEEIAGGVVVITFNPSIVTLESNTVGDFDTIEANINNIEGWVKLIAANSKAVNKTESVLGNLIFKGVSTGKTDLIISYIFLNNESGWEITPIITNGNIIITDNSGSVQEKTLLQVQGQPEIYWFQNNKLYWVTDWNVINQMSGVPGWENVNTLPSSNFYPSNYLQGPRFISTGVESDGLLIRGQGHFEVYLIVGGEKHHFTSPEALTWNGYSFDDVIDVSSTIIGMFPEGTPILVQEKKLLRKPGGINVFWSQNGELYYVNADAMTKMQDIYGWGWDDIIEPADFNPGDPGSYKTFIATGPESDGILIRQLGDYKVYRIENGFRRHITFSDVMDLYGYSMDDVIDVSEHVMNMFPLGNPIGIEFDISFSKKTDSGEIPDITEFTTGDIIKFYTQTTVSESYIVDTYVKLTEPSGRTRYAYYNSPDFLPTDPLSFSDTEIRLYPDHWNAITKNWNWNEYTFSNAEEGVYTWEFYYKDVASGKVLGRDIQGYEFTNTMTANPREITINTATDFNSDTKNLIISSYAFDNLYGPINNGAVTYTITSPHGNILKTGNLNFNGIEWASTLDLSSDFLDYGIYVVMVELSSGGSIWHDTSCFPITSQSEIKGIVTDRMGNPIEGVDVHIHKYWTFGTPMDSYTTSSNGFYSFSDLEPGFYVITAKSGNLEYISTLPVGVLGSKSIQWDIILTDTRTLQYLQSDMDSLYNNVNRLMDFETEKIAEISERVPEDAGGHPSSDDVFNLFGDVIGGWGAKGLTESAISNSLTRGPMETILRNVLYEEVKEFIIVDVALKEFFEQVSKQITFSLDEFKFTQPYLRGKASLDYLNENFKQSYNLPLDQDFSKSKTREVIAFQSEQMETIKKGDIVGITPSDPQDGLIYLLLKNNYNDHIKKAAITKFYGHSTKMLTTVQITAGSIAIFSAPTGGGGATAAFIAQVAGIAKFGTEKAELLYKANTALSYINSVTAWAKDVENMPNIYRSTSEFLKDESDNPYYLNDANKFKTDVSVDMNSIKVRGTNIILLNYLNTIGKNDASIKVKNTGNVPAAIRVSGQSFGEYRASENIGQMIAGSGTQYFAPTGYGYFSNGDVNAGEEITGTINYQAYFIPDQFLTPHTLMINVFSGPFLTSQEIEHYNAFSTFYPWVPQMGINTLSSNDIESKESLEYLRVPVSTAQGNLDISDIIQHMPNITRIINDSLSPVNSEIEVSYTVSNKTDSIEFQLFSPEGGSGVDLYVYDSKGRHVGYDVDTGNSTIGFPATYNGRYSVPEIISIPSATNKTYRIIAKLQNAISNDSVPVIVDSIEVPFRPAILAISPGILIQPAAAGDNTKIMVLIGEAGRQKPIKNLKASITNLTHADNTTIEIDYTEINIGTLPAGTSASATFNLNLPQDIPLGNYTGTINVSSDNAGNQSIPVTVEVITRIDASITLFANPIELEVGENATITASLSDSNNTPISNVPMYFSILNTTQGTLTSGQNVTDSNGIATTIFQALSEGTAYITATEPAGNNTTILIKITENISPHNITNLSARAGPTWIKFTWTNPPNPDYHHVMLFLNGTHITNVTAPQNYYNFTGLTPDTEYELGTHTVDSSGNINETWVNTTARTLPSGAVPPVAVCGPDKLRCENFGAPIQFNSSASYDPDGAAVSYFWDFGDGTNATGVAPKHTYSSYKWNGSAYEPFLVNLTVTDASGLSNSTSKKVVIWIAGDANGDGIVNILDASVVGLKWGSNDPCADLNNDGSVNILDASIIGLNWGKSHDLH